MKPLKAIYNNTPQPQFIFAVNNRTDSDLSKQKIALIGDTVTNLSIKNMVSLRCILVVKEILQKLNIPYTSVELGEAFIKGNMTIAQREQLKMALQSAGLELLEDRKSILIEKIKKVIVEMVHYQNELPKTKTSDYVSSKIHLDYNYISNLFTAATHINIQHYIIYQKIEKVKELLMYGELTLTEISYKLNYSSVAHLSNQFKRAIGMSPSCFKAMHHKSRIGLEDVG